ncbi:two-component system, sporulation sensor kinase D [Bacillus fengqiuensis]|nr:two-component system, sporulation sensor kinase D [Bacillus fengqiuensis]
MKYKQMIQSHSKRLLIYLMITVIPSIIISSILTHQKTQEVEAEYRSKAKWYASFHAKNIENFIGETIGRLDMLATVINIQHNDLNGVEKILIETQEKDPRFSGFYWANPEGDLLISSNEMPSSVNVSDRPYFQQALKTGQTSISEAHIGRVTGRFVITIATPISDDGQVKGVLLSSLRLDEIGDSIRNVIKDEMIVVKDDTGKALIMTGWIAPEDRSIQSSIDVSQLSWTATAKIALEDAHLYRHTFFQYIFLIFTAANILLLLTQYIRLKHKVKKEAAQNEIQKLELVGNLAASTAHEIRNPLTGIKGLVKLLSEEYSDKKAQFYFGVIQEEITRINAIVGELLMLGKPSSHILKTCDANDIITEIEPIIQSEANYMNVQLSVYHSTDSLPISCVKDHIKQVILNLAKNALQAMPNGGCLTISLKQNDDFCLISVEDNGEGMPKEVLDQVFNPFFTMKKNGSGLGLSVCKRIVDTCGGNISIHSTSLKGTRVEVRLPLLPESN